MPKISMSSTDVQDHGPVKEWAADMGGYTVNLVRFEQDIDGAPMLRLLPTGKCECPHWGYVLNGRHRFTFDDHVEVFEAGDAFYVAGGHTPAADAGTVMVLFSPADELRATADALNAGARALSQTGAPPLGG